jgi:nucleotide-binding universal stress UspA family protein
MLAFKTILHPTDFSESSQCALEIACGMAADYRAHLVVIHVMAAPLGLPDGATFAVPDRGLDGIRTRLDELEIPNNRIDVVRRVEEGSPATEILSVAQLCHADLIVMGSHGRSGLRRWFMGSVAEAVMRKATCPVLTVSARNMSPSLSASVLEAQAANS